MPHIHAKDGEHDHTVSAFIINPVTKKVLLHKHKVVKLWFQPGGHVELDEHPWQTMQHELLEETGYELKQLHVLQQPLLLPFELAGHVHPLPFYYQTRQYPGVNHYHTDTGYVFSTTEMPLHAIGEDESDSLTWFTEKELHELEAEVDISVDTKTVALKLFEFYPNLVAVPADSFHT